MTALAIVTVTYNAADVIDEFMESLLAQSLRDWRLFVVDNASADATLERLARWPDPRVEIIRCPTNSGASGGNNLGLEHALASAAPLILLCNNDIRFDADTLDKLVAAKRAVGPGGVSAVMPYADGDGAIWYADGRFAGLHRARCMHREMPAARIATDQPPYETDYAPTTFLLFDREAIVATGRLDDRYFAYWEDADYICRARKAGYRFWAVPAVRVDHKVSQSSGGSQSPFSVRQYFRNQMLFARKHRGRAAMYLAAGESLLRIVVRGAVRSDPPAITKAKLGGLREGLSLSADSPDRRFAADA